MRFVRWMLAGAIGASAIFAIAQVQKSSAVTSEEVARTMNRSVPEIVKVLGAKSPSFPAGKPVAASRAEIIHDFKLVFDACEPKFRVTPRPYRVDEKALALAPKSSQSELRKLIEWGFVPPYSPLVTNNPDQMTRQEFGDALGYFYNQLAALTTQPDPRWTPDLMGVDGE